MFVLPRRDQRSVVRLSNLQETTFIEVRGMPQKDTCSYHGTTSTLAEPQLKSRSDFAAILWKRRVLDFDATSMTPSSHPSLAGCETNMTWAGMEILAGGVPLLTGVPNECGNVESRS